MSTKNGKAIAGINEWCKQFLLTIKFQQNENNKNEPCKYPRQT